MANAKPVALVTGAGQGIGRGIALQLSKDGYTVAINDVVADPANLERGAYEVKAAIEKAGGEAIVCQADISKTADRERMVEEIDKAFGRIDLLVNNAGVAPKERKDILEAGEESFERLMSINLQGPYFLTQLVANKMIAYKKSGAVETPRVLFVTSISSSVSSTGRGEYCVSKAGLTMAARLFADRLGEYAIPVLEVQPGIIKTPMTSVVTEKYDNLIAGGLLPIKRWGLPEDIAKVVSAFAQGYLDYSTGECIEVGGGFKIPRL